MSIKQLVQELKQKMPDGLNELEMARYIYIELGKIKAFDKKYYFGNSKTREKIYKLSIRNRRNVDSLVKKRELICVTISYLYKAVLKEFGIDSYVEIYGEDKQPKNGEHMYSIIRLKDGRLIKADLQSDLKNVQTGMKTQFFGTVNKRDNNDIYLDSIDEEELKSIDMKIGYLKNNGKYKNAIIQNLKQKIKGMNTLEQLNQMINSDELYDVIEEMGYVEAIKHIRILLVNCIGADNIDKNIHIISCYKKGEMSSEEFEDRKYTISIFAKQKDKSNIYVYKPKSKRFVLINERMMNKLINQGLVIPNTFGGKALRNHVNKQMCIDSLKNTVGNFGQDDM